MSTVEIDVTTVNDLSATLQKEYSQGNHHFTLTGPEIIASSPRRNLLRIRDMPGITIESNHTRLNGNRKTLHVVEIENSRDIALIGLDITGGDTRNKAARIAGRPSGFENIYRVIDGGGVLVTGTTSGTIYNCNITNNHAEMCGGGVSIQQTGNIPGPITFIESEISGNSASHTGGGVDVLTGGSWVELLRCAIEGNRSNVGSSLNGPHGEITLFKSTFGRIEGCTFVTTRDQLALDHADARHGVVLFRNNIFIVDDEDRTVNDFIRVISHPLPRQGTVWAHHAAKYMIPLLIEQFPAYPTVTQSTPKTWLDQHTRWVEMYEDITGPANNTTVQLREGREDPRPYRV